MRPYGLSPSFDLNIEGNDRAHPEDLRHLLRLLRSLYFVSIITFLIAGNIMVLRFRLNAENTVSVGFRYQERRPVLF